MLRQTNRREFLQRTCQGGVALSIGAAMPSIWAEAAVAAGQERDDTLLVVVQLSGGNDGLNTVVPFRDDDYRKHRPTLALPANQVLRIDDELGLHPAMQGIADLLEEGYCSIVQGVGYPNPNRSHFESMDIWHSCRRKDAARADGWLGRFFDQEAAASTADPRGMHLGQEQQPLALVSQRIPVPSIASLDRFRLDAGGNERTRQAIDALVASQRESGNLLGFVQSNSAAALATSQRVEQAGRNYRPAVEYPDSAFAEKLKIVARLIDAGLDTRVYYLMLDGFDTHSQQADAHTSLLRKFSQGLSAFVRDTTAHGHGDRVLAMAFSEFGRRVEENASQGTDHGAAGPMFLAGRPPIHPGLIGERPQLTDLDDNGDLQYQIDFRRVYATVLERWFRCPSQPILGDRFEPLDILA